MWNKTFNDFRVWGNIKGRTLTASATATRSDSGYLMRANSASPIVIQIPNDSSVKWYEDESLSVIRLGEGTVEFSAGDGVTLRTPAGLPESVQYGVIAAVRIGANEWVLL